MALRTLACLLTLALGLLTIPRPTGAQPQATIPRIGVLGITGRTPAAPWRVTLAQALHELGYVEGQHLAFERRVVETPAQVPALVTELVGLKVDILVVQTETMARAAQQATSAIPIVVVNAVDPVGTGLIASLARPGGNITGLTPLSAEVSSKALELLKETLPGITRVAVFRCGGTPYNQREWEQLLVTAQRVGLHLQSLEMRGHDLAHVEALFTEAVRERAEALQALDCTHLVSLPREQMAGLAALHRLPAMYPWRSSVVAGGLMSYGADLENRPRRVAFYVDKILKGAKPADLPVEQPTTFKFVINLKTAKALGLTLPPMLLFRADEVIQ